MTDVFISYKREERESARRLAEALGAHGFDVWWDADILPGEHYRAVTLQILQNCRAAIVIWSSKSIQSGWVLDEATRAMERGVLVPVKLEEIPDYPLGFGQLHTHDCTSWDGDPKHAAFAPVVAAVQRLVGASAQAPRAAAASADIETEVAFWRGVQDSREAAYFESYLARYPSGLFADLARQRIEQLRVSPARASGNRAKPASRKRKPAATVRADAPKPAPSESAAASAPQPLMPLAPPPPFNWWETLFIAASVLFAAFAAWPIANRALGETESAFYGGYQSYPGDIALLFDLSSPQNIFVMTPLLTAFAWAYDRAIAWWMKRGYAPAAPRIAVAAVLALALFFSLGMRDNFGRETHFAIWLASAWIAAVCARPVTAWLRARVLELVRAMSRPSSPPPA